MTIRRTGSGEPQTEERPRPRRKAIPDRLKLEVTLKQGGRCKACGEKLHELADTQFDHRPALINRNVAVDNLDYDPPQLDPNFIEALHVDCHDKRTNGPGGEKRITTAGSDKHIRDKTKALQEQQAEYRRNLLAKDRGEEPPKPKKPKYQWPKRKMESRNSFKDRRS